MSKSVTPAPSRGRGQKGLDRELVIDRALEEIERDGLEAFSLRQAARASGCDPAALVYRFGSREGLERALVDRLHREITRLDPDLTWRERMSSMARQYRDLAARYPKAFPLLTRYWTSGPKELAVAEDSYRAILDAGIADIDVPAIDCGFYAAILGLCAGELGGLIGRPDAEMMAGIERHASLETTRRILPAISAIDADRVFETTLTVLLDGIEAKGNKGMA
ncbi:MAG: TetR/AcrR family transcriptional regulator C-terminal domain-containing protein [Hyphomicrobium sp.]|nr:TetR/AcrR family transcriptional regulator C-terminal domain-containing protein [Hyphomicrobium sp.]